MKNTKLLLLVYLLYQLALGLVANEDDDEALVEEDFMVYSSSLAPVEPSSRSKRDDIFDENNEEGSGSFPVLFDQTSPPRHYNMNQRDDLIASNLNTNSEYIYRQHTTAASRAPTAVFKKLLLGPKDQSILPIWNGVNGNHIVFTDSPITIFGSYFNSFGIHSNGYISLGPYSNVVINDPTDSITNIKFPILAPFWTHSYLDKHSDITYGYYDTHTMSSDMLTKIQMFLFNTNRRLARRPQLSILSYVPEIVHSVVWKNVKLSVSSNERATYQLLLTISHTQRAAYAIFIHDQIEWNQLNKNVFIGYTDGRNLTLTSMFSNNGDSTNNPSYAATHAGNTNIEGVNVYDLAYSEMDECTRLHLLKLVSPESDTINTAVKSFIECPLGLNNIIHNPFFAHYSNPLWQKSALCFFLRSNVFYKSSLQQTCCYHSLTGHLITDGSNSGFLYDSKNVHKIVDFGFACCSRRDWRSCRKFYDLYPNTIQPTKVPKKQLSFAWVGGDPQITTFDDLSYSFNGHGKFILCRANDSSFEIQVNIREAIILNDRHVTKTLFDSFAMKTNSSPVFQIDLADWNTKSPYMILYVNRIRDDKFLRNINYYREFPCSSRSELMSDTVCATVIQVENSSQIIFHNGLSLTFKISTLMLNQFSTISWLTCSIALLSSHFNYRNALHGLLGNNNGDKSDEVISRLGFRPLDTNNNEHVYETALTWTLKESEENLFVNLVHADTSLSLFRSRNMITSTQIPKFFDDEVVSNPLSESCKNLAACLLDNMKLGSMGAREQLALRKITQAGIDESPPLIKFRTNSIRVDWRDAKPIIIIADVSDSNEFSVDFNITNAVNFMTDVNRIAPGLSIATITYYPREAEYPIFEIKARNSRNLFSIKQLSHVYICDCKQSAGSNQCNFEHVRHHMGPTLSLVSCICDKFHIGETCESQANYCLMGNVCRLYPKFNKNIICENVVSDDEQTQLGLTYKCIGGCSKGFYKNENGACTDVNECQNQFVCPSEATCENIVGGFTCRCPPGFFYNENKCKMIDYCKTVLNECDSLCWPMVSGHYCSCYPGYRLVNDTTCVKMQTKSSSCSGCDQLCMVDDLTGKASCRCSPGFQLKSNNKTCADIDECKLNNGGCSHACTNLVGSFQCICPIGSKLDSDLKTCIDCPVNTYGLNCNQTCNCANGKRCHPALGCQCNYGFTGPDCSLLIDPCESLSLTDNELCITKAGLLDVSCDQGYFRNQTDNKCYLNDNCQNNRCPSGSLCITLVNDYTCVCTISGYSYNKEVNKCLNENECQDRFVNCPERSFCVDTLGSYKCVCRDGFFDSNENTSAWDEKNPACIDVNECEVNVSGCDRDTEYCVNQIGSYGCECRRGFNHVSSLNQTCVRVSIEFNMPMTTALAKTSEESDIPSLIVIIILPLFALMVISLLAGSLFYCGYKLRINNRTRERNMQSLSNTTTDLNSTRQNTIHMSPGQHQSESSDDTTTDQSHHSIYRTNYPIEPGIGKKYTDDFYKSLENNARLAQKTTIIRPQSMQTAESTALSMIATSAGYYEAQGPICSSSLAASATTTSCTRTTSRPYALNRTYKIVGQSKRTGMGVLSLGIPIPYDNNQRYEPDDENVYSGPVYEDELGDIIEAFNPDVRIPRPKIKSNPLNKLRVGKLSLW